MTPGMRKQYQVLNRRDFRKIIETFCPIQMIKYIQAKDKYYGEYYFESKKIYFVELDNEFFEKNSTLIQYKLAAKDQSGVSIPLEHGSCASSITSKNTTVNENRNANCYPKIQFQQGKNETCIERSMNSVLWFWLNNCTFDKPTKEKDRIKKMIGKVIKEIDIGTKNTYGKTKLKKINSILLNDNFFSCEKFPKKQKKKRKRDEEDVHFDILSEDFDKGDFTLCQLCGSDGNKNHTITITKEWIFDTNFITAMPLNEENLHKCCGQLFDTTEKKVSFVKCVVAYRYKYEVC